MRKLPTLYHFTCSHGYAGISASQELRPNTHPFMPNLGPLLWLTDLAEPTREALNLTTTFTLCDRMTYRYIVQTRGTHRWMDIRKMVPRNVLETLERYGEPEHWWVVRRVLTSSEFAFDASWKGEKVARV